MGDLLEYANEEPPNPWIYFCEVEGKMTSWPLSKTKFFLKIVKVFISLLNLFFTEWVSYNDLGHSFENKFTVVNVYVTVAKNTHLDGLVE